MRTRKKAEVVNHPRPARYPEEINLEFIRYSSYWNTQEYWGLWWHVPEAKDFTHCTVFKTNRFWQDNQLNWSDIAKRLDEMYNGEWRTKWFCVPINTQSAGDVYTAVFTNDEHWELIDRLQNSERPSLAPYIVVRDKR